MWTPCAHLENERAFAANRSDSSILQSSSTSSENVFHNKAMRFRDNDKKLPGELGQYLQEYVDEYSQMFRDYKLWQKQKLQYLHCLLFGDAINII